MKFKLYSVRDNKAELSGQVMMFVNDQVATRTLSPAVNDDTHNYGQFPEDYDLFCLGDYSDETGVIEKEKNEEGVGEYKYRKVCNLSELLVGE